MSRSPWTPPPFTTDSATDAFATAIDRLGGRALLVGLSLGGYVGIATAARFPVKVAGLAAMGCMARLTLLNASIYRLAASLAARYPDLADRVSAYGFRRALPGAPGEAVIAGALTCQIMPSVVEAVAARNPLADLAAYPGRVWLVNGSRDPLPLSRTRIPARLPERPVHLRPSAGPPDRARRTHARRPPHRGPRLPGRPGWPHPPRRSAGTAAARQRGGHPQPQVDASAEVLQRLLPSAQ
ncbi:alpha/beta fold hydrolase [Sphaerisporangium flaviroseum]|uniref:alpha/beta fold hydrolase n=1 Tax=Sphaerisporangium flaviroseum TaxID=509199 RepID=UPI003CD0A8D5